jgi:PAS domain S-box-containing protein
MSFGETNNDSTTPPFVEAPFAKRKVGQTDFRGRWHGLFLVTGLSLLAGAGVHLVDWRGSRELHSVMESVATVLAFVVGTLTLVRFYANGSVIHLCVGAGFVGTALLDGLHTFVTSTFFAKFATSTPESLILWSGNASRTFLAGILVLSCWAQARQDKQPDAQIVRPKVVYLSILALTFLSLGFFAFSPLPNASVVGDLGRLEDLISAILFAMVAGYLIRRGAWKRSPFAYWLLASVIMGVIIQGMVMSRSVKLFDGHFDLAHLMKIVSYGLVLFGVIQNIHILYRASERMTLKLSQNEAKLRGLIDQAFNFIGLLSTDGILLDGNRTALDAAGVSADDVIGMPFWETPWWTHSVEMQERLKESIRRANAGETDRFEANHPTPDGSLIYVDFTLKPIRNEAGEIIFLMPEGRNITGQKASMEALVTAELRLENALDGAEIGVWDWNVVTDDVFVSPQVTAQLGSSKTWTALTDWVDHLHPDDQDAAEKVIADYLSGEIPEYENTFRLKHVDGSYRSILSRGQLLRDEDGQPIRMVGVHIDVTERVKQQKQLARQAEELRVSNTELEQFAYVASHDLQEPLRAISGYAQLLSENYAQSLDDTGRNYANRTVEGAKRMQKLISDLLEYSRVSRKGKSFKPTDLNESVRDALVLLDAAIQESSAVIEVSDLPVVKGDPGQIVRLLQNLIGNALKYRGEAPPQIEISSEQTAEGGWWTIRVKDNGIGIAAEHAERVFDIFQRLHTREEYRGTGIGLAVCRRIVERHGGRIHVESNEDVGSTFVFTLRGETARPVSRDSSSSDSDA